MRNYFTFDGVDSRSFGVYISGQGTFKAPARSYDALEIPGRNGALLGIDSRLGNVELTYPAFIYSNFAENIAAFRAFLLSHKGYFKLKDSYHPDEFRLAYYPGPFEPDVTSANNAGSFDITFICKPQRYLESGEEVIELIPGQSETHTYTGNPASFVALGGEQITSLQIPLRSYQNLHGYDHPWPGGGGKNLVNVADRSGITTQTTIASNITLTAGTYTLSGYLSNSGSASTNLRVLKNGSQFTGTGYVASETPTRVKVSFTVSEGDLISIAVAGSAAGHNASVTKVMIEAGGSMTDYAPYSNICPISGLAGLSVYRTGKNLFDPDSLETVTVNTLERFGHKYSGVGTYAIKAYATGTAGYVYAKVLNTDGTWGSNIYVVANTTATEKTVTISAGQTLFVYNASAWTESASSELFNGWKVQVVLSSTQPDSYEPYNGNTYSVDWTTQAGTVYGGTVDVVTGELTVNKVGVDLGTLSWDAGSTSVTGKYRFLASLPDSAVNSDTTVGVTSLCSQYVALATDGTFSASNNGYTIAGSKVYIYDASHATDNGTTFRNAMSGVQFVYELDTPVTYQLTPVQIAALLAGETFVWSSNNESVTVEVSSVIPTILENPTLFDALPFLRVYGTGILGIGSHTITITAADVYTDIDCEMMDCFKGSANKNQYVQFSGNDFPTLEPGVNGFSFSGITKVEVKPRWWSV